MAGMTESVKTWVHPLTLIPPTLADNTADTDRLINALKERLKTDTLEIDLPLIRNLPELLRKFQYKTTCIVVRDHNRWILVDIAPGEGFKTISGLAVDLGTSRVVLRAVDLLNSKVLGETAFDNPQITVGPDVLTRIHYTDRSGGLEELNRLIISGLNDQIKDLCRASKIKPEDIFLLSLAGNTAMTHLFMGISPHWMIREPYIPAINRPGWQRASGLGLHLHPSARVLIFPNVGSSFGGDLIAGILYAGLNKADETAILVDVGTNAEVVVGNRNWMIACAGAAGPALEGGVTRMGMMAGPGVIDQVGIDPVTLAFTLHAIDEKPAVGICGSGLIDLVAQLFINRMIDFRGRLQPSICGGRCIIKDGMRHLAVLPETSPGGRALLISQADLDSLLRSKAAMYTILETITASVGVSFNEIKTFYVAGTFGSFIKPRSAISIGMIPDLPVNRYQSLGNSSLGGATLVLTAPDRICEIDEIRNRITYMELNVNQDFMNRFSAAKFLPHTDRTLFPSVKVVS